MKHPISKHELTYEACSIALLAGGMWYLYENSIEESIQTIETAVNGYCIAMDIGGKDADFMLKEAIRFFNGRVVKVVDEAYKYGEKDE